MIKIRNINLATVQENDYYKPIQLAFFKHLYISVNLKKSIKFSKICIKTSLILELKYSL